MRAAPVCVPIVVHANSAITTALDNDRQLAILTTNLRNVDFDKLNEIQRRNAFEGLLNQASAIRMSFKTADGEIKKLREYAVASPDPQRKKELKEFTDALGGALYRQAKAAAEFMRDMAIMQGRTDAEEARTIQARNNPTPPFLSSQALMSRRMDMPGSPKSYNQALRGVAADLDGLNTGILADEGHAADHSIAATTGC